MSYDVIVAGVGGMGSATVHHLAQRGARVLGLERFDVPHAFGSSHGVTRIIRLAYWEGPAYVPLLRRAYALWRRLEYIAGERLLFITGGIDAGAPDGATVQGSLASCAAHGLPHERLDAGQLSARFPGFHLPPDMVAVHQPDAGFLLSGRAIVAHVNAALARGAEIHAREPIASWRPDGSGVEVTTGRGRYRADRLVLTAGPWAAALCPVLRGLARPERQVLIWTQPRRPERFTPEQFPVFILESPQGQYYGFPIHGVPGFKFGKYHHRGEETLPDHVDREIRPEDEAVLREGIRAYFPEADGPTLAMATCMFTNSPDGHFILDTHPEWPQVAIAAGFSGHGFKFCSVVGEIMTDLALHGRTACDISPFRLARFTG